MTTLAFANPLSRIDSQNVALIGLPAEKPAQRSLPGIAENLFRSIKETHAQIVDDLISKRTAQEFAEAEVRALPEYATLVIAFSLVASRLIDRNTVARLNAESFSELEAEIREDGEACFGEALQQRALFTVWMLRKITDLLAMLKDGKVEASQKDQDAEFAESFFVHAIRARLHVDCLIASMHTRQPLYRDVFPQVDDGLRSIVNAYAWVKQAVDLRLPARDIEPAQIDWTADDQELLEASTYDLDRFDSD
jgi:hypothetical protein